MAAMRCSPTRHEVKTGKIVKQTCNQEILEDWRKLQTSDHFYYMCTKYFSDGDVHKYFNPYESPYDSYINFMNVLNNLKERCSQSLISSRPQTAERTS